MARRADHSREELRVLALDAAEDILAREGLEALTARAVAARIGYSPGTLYNLFANRDDLIVQTNGRTLERLIAALRAAPHKGEPEADALALADAYVDFTATRGNLWQALFEHRLPPGQDLPDWYYARIAEALRVVATALAPLYPPSREADLADAVRALWSGLHGVCSLAASNKLAIVSGRSPRDLARLLVRNFVAGLRATRPTEEA